MRPAEKFTVPPKYLGIAMQTYYGGRSETRILCNEVPVVPVDFTSEYPTCCALLGLFDVLTAANVTFEDDTKNIRRLIKRISLDHCFDPAQWKQFNFFALVQPDNDILPVRTVYDGVTQNIGNNYLTSKTPLWFAGCDVIASAIRTGKPPRILRAIRMVPHGKQAGMTTVNLRGSMVEINPYKDDLFRKVIEQRKLNKADKKLYYWLKILANSIYGFFVELIPELQNKNVPLEVFSGEKKFSDSSDVIEKAGLWFFPPLASMITSAGRLLLAMTEECVSRKKGAYLFCDTDSLAIISSKNGGVLDIPGSEGRRILPWAEAQKIANKFASLNPYDPKAVKGSILNLVDANYVDSDSAKPQRQLYGYSIAAKRYALYEKTGKSNITIVDPKAHGIGFLYPPQDSPRNWGKEVPCWIYELWDYIVRGALKMPNKPPSWLDAPQMMRLTITTCNVLEMLRGWDIARPYNFLLLPMVDPLYGFVFHRQANEKVLLVCAFSSKQEQWFDLECVNVHNGKQYKMLNCKTTNGNVPYNVVFPSQFAHLIIQYVLKLMLAVNVLVRSPHTTPADRERKRLQIVLCLEFCNDLTRATSQLWGRERVGWPYLGNPARWIEIATLVLGERCICINSEGKAQGGDLCRVVDLPNHSCSKLFSSIQTPSNCTQFGFVASGNTSSTASPSSACPSGTPYSAILSS